MLNAVFGFGRLHAERAARIEAMSCDIDRAKERQAMSSLYVEQAAGRAVETAHDTTIAARAAAALVSRKG